VLKTLRVDQIVLPSRDPRYLRNEFWEDWFSEDIKREGVMIPPLVRPIGNDKYELVDGITRFRALVDGGASTVDCDVQDLNDVDVLVKRVKLNVNRRNCDFIGVAQDLQELKDKGFKNVDIAERFGFSKSWVSKLLSLNKLDDESKELVASGELTVTQAYNSLIHKRLEHFNEDEFYESFPQKLEKCQACGKDCYPQDSKVVVCPSCFVDFKSYVKARRRKVEAEVEAPEGEPQQRKLFP